MHAAKPPSDPLRLSKNRQKDTQRSTRSPDRLVNEMKIGPDVILYFRAQLVSHLLCIPEDLQQSNRVLPKQPSLFRQHMDLAIDLRQIVADIARLQYIHHPLHLRLPSRAARDQSL